MFDLSLRIVGSFQSGFDLLLLWAAGFQRFGSRKRISGLKYAG
jgi:hypothetical protein